MNIRIIHTLLLSAVSITVLMLIAMCPVHITASEQTIVQDVSASSISVNTPQPTASPECGLIKNKPVKAAIHINKQKYSYSDMSRDIRYLAKHHSIYCRYRVIGKTCRNRNIYDVIIGNPEAKKSILMVNTLHAREYVCSVNAMKMINYYLNNYNSKINGIRPADVFENIQLHVIVMANPDGVMISQTKNRAWKANARGVDLNRNYDYHFKKKGKRGPAGFTGNKPVSENESKALVKLAKELKNNHGLCAVVNYHAMGQIVFGGYHGKNTGIRKHVDYMYKLARKLTGYADSGSYGSKIGYREYVMYRLGIPSITLEVGSTSCPVLYGEYNSVFRKNKQVMLKIASHYLD